MSRLITGGYAGSGLDRYVSRRLGNHRSNRLVWTLYPSLRRVLGNAAAGETGVVGDEWGSPAEVAEIVEQYILPHVDGGSVVSEIGVGGGRVARHVAPHVAEFHAIDISRPMLREARAALRGLEHVHYERLTSPRCPQSLRRALDFVYAFDVFVHFDLHELWRYTQLMHEMLRSGGKAMVHVASLATPLGWSAFEQQKGGSIGGLCFVTPDVVRLFAARAGFTVVAESAPRATSGYLSRDHIAVLEKHEADGPASERFAPTRGGRER